MNNTRNVLVTGGAGFIGSHLVDKLLAAGDSITVFDNFNDYYSPAIKRDNIKDHLKSENYRLVEGDLRDPVIFDSLFAGDKFDIVVHLAGMAGVRPSLENPLLYMDVNVAGTQRLLQKIVNTNPQARMVFGSSSSVYGKRSGEMFVETDRVDQPLSPYAASKICGEMQCFGAHHISGLDVVSLRFFTVYGPRQRPDLAIHKFCSLIEKGEPIDVYGDGSSKRDYTFIEDIVSGITAAMNFKFSGYEVINLGRSEPTLLLDMIKCLESSLGKTAKLNYKPMPVGDVPYTYACIDKAKQLLGYQPKVSIQEGIEQFVKWHRTQHVGSTAGSAGA